MESSFCDVQDQTRMHVSFSYNMSTFTFFSLLLLLLRRDSNIRKCLLFSKFLAVLNNQYVLNQVHNLFS